MKKNFIKKISVIWFLLSLLLIFWFWEFANAWWIVLSPPKFEFSWNKWQVINWIVKITNKDDKVLILNSDIQDFIAWWETWQPKFVSAEKNTHSSLSLAKWIVVNWWNTVEVKPWEKKEIPFTVTIPENAEPWGHYWSIFFFPPAWKWQVAVVQKIGSLILVKVNWEIRREWKILDFWAFDKEMTWEEIAKTSSKTFFTKLPVNFSVRFENTWNIHIKPTWEIKIFWTFWNQLKPVWVKSIVNKKWLKLWDEIVDYLPINDWKWNVLADSVRRFDSTWKWSPFWYKNENWTKEVRYSWWVKNYSEADLAWKVWIFIDRIKSAWIYSAEMTLIWAKWEKIKEKVSFTIFPFVEIFWWLFWLIILIFWLIKYRSFSRRKMEEKIRKQMKEMMKNK